MTFQFKPAVREETSLLIGIAGSTGSGKTYSALQLATGLAGGGKIAVIDTEAGRALHYADQFNFEHGDLKPPFTPENYIEAIAAADAAGFKVIMIDSMSHEWEGDGGLQDMQLAELERMCTDSRTGQVDHGKMQRMTAPAWKMPKLRHKKMVNRLLQCRAHLIFCLRAEEKMKMKTTVNEKGYKRTEVIAPEDMPVNERWVPICEKRFMYEMTVSLIVLPQTPGIPIPIKIQEQHRFAFPEGQHISRQSGEKLAQWARGNKPVNEAPVDSPQCSPAPSTGGDPQDNTPRSGPAGAPNDEDFMIMAREQADHGVQHLRDWYKTLKDADKAAFERNQSKILEWARKADEVPV